MTAPKLGRPRTVRSPDDPGRGERLDVTLDAPASLALVRLRSERKFPKAECLRDLLVAWSQDANMRKAFSSWCRVHDAKEGR